MTPAAAPTNLGATAPHWSAELPAGVKHHRHFAWCLAELATETAKQNFTFAELEENEHELQKLASWLPKIQARDFFPGPAAAQARTALRTGHEALQRFAETVYTHAGLGPAEPAPDADAPARE